MGRKFRVLIVDDDVNLASNLKDILEAEGYTCLTAHDGQTALALCRKKAFGLAVIDLKLPDTSGIELIQTLGKLCPEMEYIIATGYVSLDSAIEAVRQKSVVSYEAKPIDIGHILTLVKQVARRKQAEEALGESEERYRILFKSANDAVFAHHPTPDNLPGKFFEVNDAACKMLGYTRKEVFNLSPMDIVAWDKAGLTPEEAMKNLASSGQALYESIFIAKDGREIPVEVNIHLFELQGQPTVLTVARDITERKKAEEAMAKSEERYHSVFSEARDGITIVDRETGSITDCNPEFEKQTGRTLKQLKEMKIWEIITPEKGTAAIKKFLEIQCSGIGDSADLEFQKPNGEIVDIEFRARQIDIQGKKYLQSISRDITERKKADEALVKSESRFRRLFEESNDAIFIHDLKGNILDANNKACTILGYSRDALLKMTCSDLHPKEELVTCQKAIKTTEKTGSARFESKFIKADGTLIDVDISSRITDREKGIVQGIARDITEHRLLEKEQQKVEKLEALGILAGGLAHDFNNILTGIVGNISLARRHVEPGGKAADRLAEADKASLRARDLTHQLLTFAKGGAPIKQVTSVAELLEESIGFALRGSNVRYELSLAEDLWVVDADATQLSQVIANLVINADEAMPEGGVLNIGARNMVIRRKGALPLARGSYVEVTVQDHGIGMSKEHLGRIFDPYFTTKQKGSGLGLATAFSIIKNHGGHITVKSKLAVGTTFCVYLPALAKQAPAEKGEVEESPVTGRGRILVMDDDGAIRLLLDRVLTGAGYKVALTEDGVEAVKQYKKAKRSGQPFAAVILDLTIPGGLGGKQVIKKLLEIDPGVKAIVSSGYSNNPVMADFKRYGFSEVVAKPYKAREIEQKLRSIMTSGK